jgi:hypothetical protein
MPRRAGVIIAACPLSSSQLVMVWH